VVREFRACLIVIAVLGGGVALWALHASDSLLQRLTCVRHLPQSATTRKAVIYVLGGTLESLEAKFRTASRLIHEGQAARVLVLSQPGLMAFKPDLGRNPTFNEWVTGQFAALGVAADAIEFVAIEEGFFGTWSEADGLSRLVRARGLGRLILVTSPLHSRRAWESFSRTVEQPEANLFMYLSVEPTHRRHLLVEHAKLMLYRALLFDEREIRAGPLCTR
jgi:uncharacterized SAM-binding protein YcdF (DUF218 family)